MFNNAATYDRWGNLTSPEQPAQNVRPPTAAWLGQGSTYGNAYDFLCMGYNVNKTANSFQWPASCSSSTSLWAFEVRPSTSALVPYRTATTIPTIKAHRWRLWILNQLSLRSSGQRSPNYAASSFLQVPYRWSPSSLSRTQPNINSSTTKPLYSPFRPRETLRLSHIHTSHLQHMPCQLRQCPREQYELLRAMLPGCPET